jgi:hypothetical protein
LDGWNLPGVRWCDDLKSDGYGWLWVRRFLIFRRHAKVANALNESNEIFMCTFVVSACGPLCDIRGVKGMMLPLYMLHINLNGNCL